MWGGDFAIQHYEFFSLRKSVAKGFNQSGSGYGIVKIDMNKVTSASYKGYEIYPRANGVEGLPYHYSVWQQETSVYQSIPLEAGIDYFN